MYCTRSLPNVGVIGIPAARQVHLVHIHVRQHLNTSHYLKSEHLKGSDFWKFQQKVSGEVLKKHRKNQKEAKVAPDGRCSCFA